MKKAWFHVSLSIRAVVLATQPRLLRGAPPLSCGTNGSVRERIADCATRRSSSGTRGGFEWRLVTHVPEGSEVWRDEATGLVWSDTAGDHLEQDQAETRCGGSAPHGEDGFIPREEVRWRLPSHDDYVEADAHGLRELLPNMLGHRFWTATLLQRGFRHYYVFDGTDGDFIFLDYRGDTRGVGVRCVGAGV